jgi:hypothetical protein
LSKLLPKLYHGNLCYFCDVSKLPKVNNRPIGKNTPNLVTLYPCRATISIYTLQEKLFLETQKSSPHFWATLSTVQVMYQFWKKRVWLDFGRFFANKSGHPVCRATVEKTVSRNENF